MKVICFISISLVLAYLGFCLFAYLFSDSMIFPVSPRTYTQDETIEYLTLSDGTEIAFTYSDAGSPDGPAYGYTLLMSHGNGEDIGMVRPFLEFLQEQGFNTFIYDYPGYGLSDGKPNEQNVYESVRASYRYLVDKKGISPEKIVLYGRSVGGGPTVELASKSKVAGVILEAPFMSAFRVVTKINLLPGDKFQNINKIDKIDAPILIVHGTADKLISIRHGKALFEKAKEPKIAKWVEGAGHNNLLDTMGEDYYPVLNDFLRAISNSGSSNTRDPEIQTR